MTHRTTVRMLLRTTPDELQNFPKLSNTEINMHSITLIKSNESMMADQRHASSFRSIDGGTARAITPTPPMRCILESEDDSSASSSAASGCSDVALAFQAAASTSASSSPFEVTQDHPLLVDGRKETIDVAVALMAERNLIKAAPLSTLAFKTSKEKTRRSRRSPKTSRRRRHSSHECRNASAAVAKKPIKRSSTNDAVADITDEEKTIIALKLELAQAKSEAEHQASLVEKLTKQNEVLTQRVKRCETEVEINLISAKNLEDATYEIEELLLENQRLQSDMETITYERNELKSKLGMMTVSKPKQHSYQEQEHHSQSTSTLGTLGESFSTAVSMSSDQQQQQATSRHDGGVGHRPNAMKLLSSFRSSVRFNLGAEASADQHVSPEDLLWADDDSIHNFEDTTAA